MLEPESKRKYPRKITLASGNEAEIESRRNENEQIKPTLGGRFLENTGDDVLSNNVKRLAYTNERTRN